MKILKLSKNKAFKCLFYSKSDGDYEFEIKNEFFTTAWAVQAVVIILIEMKGMYFILPPNLIF